jgi:hypothetical protein
VSSDSYQTYQQSVSGGKLLKKIIGHRVKKLPESLAEAIIMQSMEDLWNSVFKTGSLAFFKGDGFELCSEIAGISYIKQLVMLRMLAYAGPKTGLHKRRTSLP